MEILEKKQDCCGCHACYNACPVKAIEMLPNSEGFLYPVIRKDKCIHCNKCQNVCPILHKPKVQPLKEVYGCKAKLDEERMSSTSGGVFAVLARAVLLKDGIICGAVFDENQELFHLIANDENGLMRMKGTKYVQSRIGNAYRELKKYLEEGKQVLFSGTPCQVAGLKSYLGREYENLLCVDLICHGVPSPEVWKRYLKEIAGTKKVAKVVFRNKQKESNSSTIDYHFDNGEVEKEVYGESLYTKGFIQNLYVRPSCFQCQFKGMKRCSDMTIGDFWSVKEYHPEFADNYGTSAVILHSKKGKQWFEKILGALRVVKATPKEIACWNECLLQSTKCNSRREVFFEKWNEESMLEVIRELVKESPKFNEKSNNRTIFSRAKSFMKRIL